MPRAAGKQLQGSLKYFDLATVIQTLIGSHQTGALVVSQDKHRVAEIFFFRGNIARARYRQLVGDDAVFQLFQSPVEGDFSFTGREVREEEVQVEISMPAISILMESVRLQDELPMLKERLSDSARVFRQKAPHLSWEEPDTLELAAAVWSRLKRGASLEDLQREVPRSLARDLPDGHRPSRRRADRVGRARRQTRVASRICCRIRLPSERASPSSRVIRVIAFRFARKDQFAASSSSPVTTAIPTAFHRRPVESGAPFMPSWYSDEDDADTDPVDADAEAGPGVGELGFEPAHELLVLAQRVAQRPHVGEDQPKTVGAHDLVLGAARAALDVVAVRVTVGD